MSLSVFLIHERGFVHANDMTSYLTVLNRVKDFLPRMKEAGQQLEKELHEKSPSELDIESVDDSAPYIEMVNMKISLKGLESVTARVI